MVQGKYVEKRPERKVFSISMQHYSMAGAAFARFLRDLEEPYYNAQILEGRMADVIADVAAGRSEIGFVHFADDKEPAMIKTLHNERWSSMALPIPSPACCCAGIIRFAAWSRWNPRIWRPIPWWFMKAAAVRPMSPRGGAAASGGPADRGQ